eukprot:m.130971 g.130971  ORF g.130971 m.130971 type:complete len:473 (+) comp22394_c0_seq1:344-1762(+)
MCEPLYASRATTSTDCSHETSRMVMTRSVPSLRGLAGKKRLCGLVEKLATALQPTLTLWCCSSGTKRHAPASAPPSSASRCAVPPRHHTSAGYITTPSVMSFLPPTTAVRIEESIVSRAASTATTMLAIKPKPTTHVAYVRKVSLQSARGLGVGVGAVPWLRSWSSRTPPAGSSTRLQCMTSTGSRHPLTMASAERCADQAMPSMPARSRDPSVATNALSVPPGSGTSGTGCSRGWLSESVSSPVTTSWINPSPPQTATPVNSLGSIARASSTPCRFHSVALTTTSTPAASNTGSTMSSTNRRALPDPEIGLTTSIHFRGSEREVSGEGSPQSVQSWSTHVFPPPPPGGRHSECTWTTHIAWPVLQHPATAAAADHGAGLATCTRARSPPLPLPPAAPATRLDTRTMWASGISVTVVPREPVGKQQPASAGCCGGTMAAASRRELSSSSSVVPHVEIVHSHASAAIFVGSQL